MGNGMLCATPAVHDCTQQRFRRTSIQRMTMKTMKSWFDSARGHARDLAADETGDVPGWVLVTFVTGA